MSPPLNFLIVHGAYGSPEENWFPWLKRELSTFGNILVPQFPTPEGQNLAAWMSVAETALKNISPQNTILIGHSTGAITVLRMAEKTLEPFKAVFPICPFDHALGIAKFDKINATFFTPVPDWKAVARGANKIICYAGDNDPYVPLAYSRNIADALNAELITVEKDGHLNAEAGYHEFPALLNRISQLCEMEKV